VLSYAEQARRFCKGFARVRVRVMAEPTALVLRLTERSSNKTVGRSSAPSGFAESETWFCFAKLRAAFVLEKKRPLVA